MQGPPGAGLREEGVVGSYPSSGSTPLCARCGSPLAPDARFCGHCGLTVSGDAGQRLPAGPRHAAAGPDGGSDAFTDFLLGIDLLRRYPVMVTPPLIAMCGVVVVGVLFFGSAMSLFAVGGLARRGPGMVGAVLGSAILVLVFFAVAMLINLVSSAAVVVMASDAFAARKPSLGAAYGMVLARLGDVVGASFLCSVIIGIASVFLIIPGLIAAFFLMFALPAVLLDGARPTESLRRSATLVQDNIGRALGLVVGAIVASVVTWLTSIVLHVIPVIGHLASMLLAGVFVAYLTVVAVRVFQTLPRR
jgi:zinc ribbon protein